MNSISPNLNIMIKACEKASKTIIRDFGEVENLQVSKKGPRDFVTKTDRRVESILIDELSKNRKNFSFITEENGIIKNNDLESIWIIDPIDGTTNFLHGIPHFAISVALKVENNLSSSIIFDPIKNEIFFAERNKGAYYNNQRIKVSKKNEIEECLFATNLEGVKFSNLNMRHSGCAALDLAYVGAGRYDGFFYNKLNIWDIAAGLLIIEEAGGVFNKVDYNMTKNIDVRASSDRIYKKMIENLENF